MACILSCGSLPCYATKTILHGVVNKTINQPIITVQFYSSPLDDIERTKTEYKSAINEDKHFRMEMDIERPVSINVMAGDEWLFYNKYILPGDSLYFECSEGMIDVSGMGEERMSFQFEFDNVFYNQNKIAEFQNAQSFTGKEYAAYLKKLLAERLAFKDKYFEGKKVDAAFINAYESEMKYDYLVSLAQYNWRAGNKARLTIKDTSYFNYILEIPIQNKEALVSTRYIHFIRELPYALWTSNMDRDNKESQEYQYYSVNQFRLRDSIAREYFSGEIYDLSLYGMLLEQIGLLDKIKGKPVYEEERSKVAKAIELAENEFHNKLLYKRAVAKLEELTGAPKPAHDFVAYDVDGKKVNLSDFKGKIVYVDFWATNCFPCRQEFAPAKKLEDQFKGKDVVFLYVSLDQRKEDWKRFLKEKSLSGNQLIEPKGFGADVALLYNISSIPRYLLVDRDGMLISERAPRPSENAEEIIRNALK